MLTKKRDFRGSFTVIRHEKFHSRLLRTEQKTELLYFVLIYVLFTVIFVFETAQAMLWVPEIRDDSPRRSMHVQFHSSRFNFDNGLQSQELGPYATRQYWKETGNANFIHSTSRFCKITHFCPVMSTFRLNFVPRNLGLFGQRPVAKRTLDLDSRVACACTGFIVTVLRFTCEGILSEGWLSVILYTI